MFRLYMGGSFCKEKLLDWYSDNGISRGWDGTVSSPSTSSGSSSTSSPSSSTSKSSSSSSSGSSSSSSSSGGGGGSSGTYTWDQTYQIAKNQGLSDSASTQAANNWAALGGKPVTSQANSLLSSSGGSSSSGSGSSSSGSSMPAAASPMSITTSSGNTVQGYYVNGHAYYPNGAKLQEGDIAHTAGGNYKVVNGVGVLQSGASSQNLPANVTKPQATPSITQLDINKAVADAIAKIQANPNQQITPTLNNPVTDLGTALSSAVEVPEALKSLIDAISYNAMSESERQSYAESLAGQKYGSVLNTLGSQKVNLDTEAQNALSQLEAQYSDREANTSKLVSEAQSSALKSAISRGGGRAGLVEYLVEKLSAPIYQADQQALKEENTKKQSIQNSLSTAKSGIDSQITQTEADKSNYLTSVIQEIVKNDAAASTETNFNKANIMSQALSAAQQGNLTALQTTLPYLAMTAKDKASTDLSYLETMGQTANSGASAAAIAPSLNADTSAGSALTGLRSYLTNKGVSVGWNAANPHSVTLGATSSSPGTQVSSDVLKSYGGTLQNGDTWMLPQDNLEKLLKAYGLG